MGTPIKERGIHWVENYGDKSNYLKTEMEEQVGPGSYFRWEGHDSTTGNDYYVVVSPGYSPTKGYHFFAGLRKMPAENGASGKKFNNMRAALYYAYDTWRVPKPQSMPAGWHGYEVGDIKGKDIVMEGVHASVEKPVKSGGIVITSPAVKKKELEVEAMAVQTMSGGLSGSRVGSQVLAQQYCNAYKAAPVTGFLPALFSTVRLMGLDGTNFNRNEAAVTENRFAPKTSVPVSPLVATCQHPSPEEFSQRYDKGVVVTERLYEMPSAFERNDKAYASFKKPLKTADPNAVEVRTWGDMSTNMYVHVPASIHDEQFILKWQAQLPIGPREGKAKKKSNIQDHEYVVSVNANNMETYQAFVDDLTARVRKISHGGAKPVIVPQDDDGKNFVRLWMRARNLAKSNPELAREHGVDGGFRADQPYLQVIRQTGTQMLDYDINGLPMKLVVQTPMRRAWQQESTEEDRDTVAKPIYYVLADRVAMVDRNVPGFAEAWRNKDRRACDEFLEKFHAMADENRLPYPPTHEDVYDHRTMAPVMSNPMVRVPMVNNNKLPIDADGRVLPPDEISGMESPHYRDVPMMSPSKVQAHRLSEGKFGARFFDPSSSGGAGGYVFDDADSMLKLPTPVKFQRDKEGYQPVVGAPTIIEKSAMLRKGNVNFRVEAAGNKAKIRFDGRVSASRTRELEGAGFKFQASKGLSNGQWVGRYNQLPDPYLVEEGQVDGFYTIQRGESTLYDPNSRGKVVPGNAYDVMYGPSMGDMNSPGVPSGFGIAYVKHKAVNNPESHFDPSIEELTVRQQSPSQFTDSVPSQEELHRKDGDVFDPAFVGVSKGKVIWKDSLAGLRYLKEKLDIDDDLVFPFCRMTDMDLKVIKDRAAAGRRTYEQYGDREADVPENMREVYRYGKVLASCSEKGESIPNEVFQALAEELRDPAKALAPRQAEDGGRDGLMALLVIPDGVQVNDAAKASGQYYWGSPDHAVENLRGGGVVLAPDYKGNPGSYEEGEIDGMFPGVHSLRGMGFQFTAVEYRHASGARYSQPSMASREGPPSLTYGDDKFLASMGVKVPENTGKESIEDEDMISPTAEDMDTGLPVKDEDISLHGESVRPAREYPEEMYATPEEAELAVPGEEVPESSEEWLPGRTLVDLTRGKPAVLATTIGRLEKLADRLGRSGDKKGAFAARKAIENILKRFG